MPILCHFEFDVKIIILGKLNISKLKKINNKNINKVDLKLKKLLEFYIKIAKLIFYNNKKFFLMEFKLMSQRTQN